MYTPIIASLNQAASDTTTAGAAGAMSPGAGMGTNAGSGGSNKHMRDEEESANGEERGGRKRMTSTTESSPLDLSPRNISRSTVDVSIFDSAPSASSGTIEARANNQQDGRNWVGGEGGADQTGNEVPVGLLSSSSMPAEEEMKRHGELAIFSDEMRMRSSSAQDEEIADVVQAEKGASGTSGPEGLTNV